ncbi:hypothetical protein VTK26DRAFT_8979 [Humicola hyalothermophila]
MTFVLALAIVAVFCAGLVKLWWNNRLMKKQEALDEETRARIEEMRKAGLEIPIKRANQVPFGVRAIQSGIEVDGIWISRPASLNETTAKPASSSNSVVGNDWDSQKKGKGRSEDEGSVVVTTTRLDRRSGKQTSPDVPVSQGLTTDSDSVNSTQSAAISASQFAYKAKRHSSRLVNVLNEDTLRRLEGQAPSGPPKSPLHDAFLAPSSKHYRDQNPTEAIQQSSESSSGASVDSQPRSSATGSAASGKGFFSSSRSPVPHLSGNSSHPYGNGRTACGHDVITATTLPLRRWRVGTETGEEGSGGQHHSCQLQRDPFATPPPPQTRTPSGLSELSVASHSQGRDACARGAAGTTAAEPTFGLAGDLRFNRVSRRVNDGFEILPAGTFGIVPGEVDAGGAGDSRRQSRRVSASRPGNKLRKSAGQRDT